MGSHVQRVMGQYAWNGVGDRRGQNREQDDDGADRAQRLGLGKTDYLLHLRLSRAHFQQLGLGVGDGHPLTGVASSHSGNSPWSLPAVPQRV